MLDRQEYDRKHLFFNSLSIGPAQTVAQRAIKCHEYRLTQSLLEAIIFLHF